MERLNLSEKPAHSLQESAIHCARYANILHLVKDKVVLDIACGEGYGSALLMKAGAKRVVGVDISEESIERAKKLFGKYDVEYIVSDANTISERYGEDFFDIVVSIETIEHINTPDVFLREGANKQVISSQADSLIKISRIWADFFPANTSNQPI
nr:class I SAM-dependent methyltransferase [Shigella flexneri]